MNDDKIRISPDALIAMIVTEAQDRELAQMPSLEEMNEDFQPSEKFQRKMEALVHDTKRKAERKKRLLDIKRFFITLTAAISIFSCTIQDIQNGDREQALALWEKFSPLLKKYAFFLQSEDALQDFQCFLLAFAKNLQLNELTISTDGAIISYINKAIYHHYIALSKAKRHQLPTVSIESQTDYDPLQFDTAFSESDTYNNLLLLDLKRALSTEEYHVIYDHYFRQYSIQEIATRDNKSRQAINKCKKTAIIKLRRYFGVTS